MKIRDGIKDTQDVGGQNYNLVMSMTNIHWQKHVEGTFYARNPYFANKDWLDRLQRGETQWEGY